MFQVSFEYIHNIFYIKLINIQDNTLSTHGHLTVHFPESFAAALLWSETLQCRCLCTAAAVRGSRIAAITLP